MLLKELLKSVLFTDRISLPMITNITTDSQTESSIAIRVTLQPPIEGQACVQNYTVTVQVRDMESSSNTTDAVDTNPIDVLVRGLSVCPSEYTVTAVACGRTVSCSSESVAVYNATSGKYLFIAPSYGLH